MAKATDDRRELRKQTLQVSLAGHEASAPTITPGAIRDTIPPHGGGPSGTSPILVKAGTIIAPNSFVSHRLAPCYEPDPAIFRPKRWEHLRPGWNYLPFGGGTRMCAARNLGLIEMAYVLARMVQEWKGAECRDDVMEWVEEIKLSVESRNGVKAGVKWA
ncbi:hypothetical protein ACHAP3_007147 [Botrytis cinerea]